jgi:hypothetical protein
MQKWIAAALVVVAATASSCGKKKDSTVASDAGKPAATGSTTPGAAAAGARADVTSALWAYAPANASFGLVLGDGVGNRVRLSAKAMFEEVGARPIGAIVTGKLAELRKDIGFDPLDEAGWKSVGLDPSKGFAIFVDLSQATGKDKERPVMVLPVVDRAAFRVLAKAKVETVDGKEVDTLDGGVRCLPVADRYFCAKELADIDAATKPHDSKLAAAVKALPADARGDLELYADVTTMPDFAAQTQKMAMFGKIETTGLALRVENDGFLLRGWTKGAVDGPVGTALRAGAPRADFASQTGGAATVMRFTMDPKFLFQAVPAQLPLGGVDLRTDLVDQLTGEFQFVSAGKGLIAGTILAGVEDTAKVTGALKSVCAIGKASIGQKQSPITRLDLDDKGCKGEISLAQFEKQMAMTVPPIPFSLAVEGKLLVLRVGDVDPARAAGNAADDAGSGETRALLATPATFMAWSRSTDLDLDAVPSRLVTELKKQEATALLFDAISYLGLTVYESGLGVTVSGDGASLLLRVTTFGGDPAEARAAYLAALDKRKAGDRAGYLAALGEVAKKFPATKFGKRARLEAEGTPVMGPGAAILAGALATFAARAASSFDFEGTTIPEDQIPKMQEGTTPPPAGGSGFGKKEAAPEPAPAPATP